MIKSGRYELGGLLQEKEILRHISSLHKVRVILKNPLDMVNDALALKWWEYVQARGYMTERRGRGLLVEILYVERGLGRMRDGADGAYGCVTGMMIG